MAAMSSVQATMKEQFYAVFLQQDFKLNSFVLTQEKYWSLIDDVKRIKSTNKKECSRDYRLLQRYDVVFMEGSDKLIKPLTEEKPEVKFYVPVEEIFDIMYSAHLATGHGGRDRMKRHLNKNYNNITQIQIQTFLDLCESCEKKKKGERKSVTKIHQVRIRKRSEQQGLANSDSVQNLDSAKKEQPELLETAITIKEEPLNSFHFETTLAEDFSIEDCSRVKEEPDFIDIKEEIGVSASFESGTEDTLDAFNANGVEKPSKINDDPVSRDLDLVDLMFLDFARRFKLFSARTQITVNSRICHMLAEVEMNEMEARQQHAA